MEQIPQRFRFKANGKESWSYGAAIPQGEHWRVTTGRRSLIFIIDPWEVLGAFLGDIDAFEWIDSDYGWAGDVMPILAK